MTELETKVKGNLISDNITPLLNIFLRTGG